MYGGVRGMNNLYSIASELDSRVASLPYESSSLAHPSPLRGPLPLKGTQERYGIYFQCHMAK